MKKGSKYFCIILLALVSALLAYAILGEKHDVFNLSKPEEKKVSGFEYTETATFDGFMLKNGKVYDIYSLTPDVLQIKDCST